jgi:XkdW protein
MTLYDKIKQLYPQLTDTDFGPLGTITLQNDSDGRGDYIKEWTHELPQPTAEQLGAI